MASIDNTYTNSYDEYKEFKDWANNQRITFFDGLSICVGDFVLDYEKDDFRNGEITIMNTPTWLDVYLIQNCKIEFVINRMKEVYGNEYYKELQQIDLTARPPENFRQNRKITIKRSQYTMFPFHSKPYKKNTKWHLTCDADFRYYDKTKKWISDKMDYPYNTYSSSVTSVKALVRHLRKQYLPKGVVFKISGRYVGEEYLVLVS
jgi:hypothetical protein